MIANVMFGVQGVKQWALIVLALAALSAPTAVFADERDTLRVCADPNNLPFSNQAQHGFENKIAELFGQALKRPVEYTWFPQRRGFIRNTLRSQDPISGQYKCDLVLSVPVQFELGLVTQPYYRSTWALVVRKDSALGQLQAADELLSLPQEAQAGLKIGVFDQTPGAVWLGVHGFTRQMVGYPTLNADPDEYPGQIIARDLQQGHLDGAIVWGPIAGYFVANSDDQNLTILPLRSGGGIRFDFAIAMAVRYGEKDWRDQIKTLIEQNQNAINEILQSYHVPLVDKGGNLL